MRLQIRFRCSLQIRFRYRFPVTLLYLWLRVFLPVLLFQNSGFSSPAEHALQVLLNGLEARSSGVLQASRTSAGSMSAATSRARDARSLRSDFAKSFSKARC